MKKIIILPLLVLVTGCSILNCSNDSIISDMGIKDTTCEIVEGKDTHSGFLGDGDYFAKIKCSKIEDKLNKKWKVNERQEWRHLRDLIQVFSLRIHYCC